MRKNKLAAQPLFKSAEQEKIYLEAYDNTLKNWPVKFTEKDIATSFGTAHIIIAGPPEGDPLVLLHGMDASSTMWYANIKALSENNRVFAIDLILEAGKSRPEKRINTRDHLIAWYDEIFDSLNIKNFSLAGASRGGWLSILIARHSQNKIRKIILLSPAQTFKAIRPKGSMVRAILFSIIPHKKILQKVLKDLSVAPDKLNKDFVEQFFIASNSNKKPAEIMKMLPYTDAELKELKMPVLLLIGDKDVINDHSCITRAKRTVSVCETEIIFNSGHFLALDQPELVNKKMIEFLQKNK